MAAKIYINNVDVASLGVIPTGEYYKYFYSLPETNEVAINEWYEGQVDVDLQDGVTFKNEKKVVIDFYCKDFNTDGLNLVNSLKSQAYNVFKFGDIGEELSLRFSKLNIGSIYNNACKFSIELIQDDYNRVLVDNHIVLPIVDNYCSIDGLNINEYGFTLLESSSDVDIYEEEAIERIKYATSDIKTQVRSIKLKLGSNILSLGDFNKNYYSLIHLLIKPNLRALILTFKGNSYSFNSFFEKLEINELFVYGVDSVWCEIEITLKLL